MHDVDAVCVRRMKVTRRKRRVLETLECRVCVDTLISAVSVPRSRSLSQTLALCCWTHSVTVVVVVCCLSSTLHIYLDTENGLSPSVLRQRRSLQLQLVEILPRDFQMFASAKVRDVTTVFNKLHFLLIKDLLKKS